MRKNILLALTMFTGSVFYANAQTQLVNGNMELWDNAGTANQEPQQWNSFKTGNCSLGILCGSAQEQRLERSTDIRPGSTGTYSARIYSTSVIGIIANGNLTTGQIQLGSSTANNSANHNKTLTANAAHRMPITALPDSIVFWAKYQPGNNSTTNQARMRAVLHDNYDYRDPSASDPNAPSHIVAEATRNFTRTYTSTYVWQRFAVPFTYTGPSTSPAYMLVTFTTNMNPGEGAANDQVWIDDVELIYVPITTTTTTINPLSYNVSPTVGASISVPFTKTGTFAAGNIFTAQLSDANGSFASPVNIGTLSSTTAGTISGTIPANTPSGTGYRVRVISSTPYQTANANTSNITINLVSNSIAPIAAQTIAASTNGNILSVTESTTATSREWKFATVSGGPYSSFGAAETATSYTPNFANAGIYYVVCESTFGSLSARSNEVAIAVVKNQITPAGSQSLLVSNAGSLLTVTETPAGLSREWLYSTTAGGPYISFAPTEIGNTYLPLFNSVGTYYVVCKSQISGLDVTSNEVEVSVGNLNITTGTIVGSPFEFSASAPNANISVPYTVSGAFNGGNTFTAQLSDANGSFTSATVIGSVSATNSGTINATIPSNTPAGTNYLIRVIGSDPSTLGSDNGTALVVDQYNNPVTPATPQTFVYTTTGNQLTVNESQNTTSREWRVSAISGGPYTAIPGQSAITYTPSSPMVGTFYLVCASTNTHGDEVISNEVMITVENGNTINTSTVAGSPFYVSPSANNQVTVNFTSDVIFNGGNVFTAQLSNSTGSFAVPTNIGTLTATAPGAISGIIPNIILDGTGYRIRVISSAPAVIGTDNGTDLTMSNFTVALTPTDTQYVATGVNCAPITFVTTHPGTTVEWKYRTSIIGGYFSFNPPVTGNTFVRAFTAENPYEIVAEGENPWGDILQTTGVVINVSNSNITETENGGIKAFMSNDLLMVDLANSTFQHPEIQIINMAGQVVFTKQLQGKAIHTLPISLASGIYTYRISENGRSVSGKIPVL